MDTQLNFLNRAVAGIALTVSLAALVLAIGAGAYQITSRFLLGQPSTLSEVLIRASLTWMVFFGLPLCIQARHLATVTFLRGMLTVAGQRRLEIAVALLIAALCAYLTYYGIAILERVRFQRVAGLGVSIAWMYAAIPLGSFLAMLAALGTLNSPPAGPEVREV